MKIAPLLGRILIAALCVVAMRIWGGRSIETFGDGQPMTAQRGIVLLGVPGFVIFLVSALRIWKK